LRFIHYFIVHPHKDGAASYFFFECYGDHPHLHSFPTRRSSDLIRRRQSLAWLRAPSIAGPTRTTTAILRTLSVPSTSTRAALKVDRKSTRLNSSHVAISYAVFCLKKKSPTIMRSQSITSKTATS